MKAILTFTFWNDLPSAVQDDIVPVDKLHQLNSTQTDSATGTALQKTTGETVWLPSMYEVFGMAFSGDNESEGLIGMTGYAPFQYIAYQGNAGSITNTRAIRSFNGAASNWWLRSARQGDTSRVCLVNLSGNRTSDHAVRTYGATPAFCL